MSGYWICEGTVINDMGYLNYGLLNMPKNVYTKEQYEEALRLRKLGYGKRRIARKMGINMNTIYSWYAQGKKPRSVRPFHHTEESKEKIRRAKLRDKNPNWGGNNVKVKTGYIRARRWFECEEGKERHHIDGNPLNNDPENIMFVTRKEHMILDGRLEKLRKKEWSKK